MKHNKKPYQARVLLKSIQYWQSVANGINPAKRPLAYYTNHLKRYEQKDIDYLTAVSKTSLVKSTNHK